MSDRNNLPGYPGVRRRTPPPPMAVNPTPGNPAPPEKPAGRHEAIRSKLPNWSSYKNWVEKARGQWEKKDK